MRLPRIQRTRRSADGRIEFAITRRGVTCWYQLRNCVTCGQEFYGRAHDVRRGRANTCSRGCQAQAGISNLGQYALVGAQNPNWLGETYDDYAKNGGRLSMPQWARNRLLNAVRRGWIKRGSCAECGSEENIEGHHEDYSKPYQVIWLCRTDHAKLERRGQPDEEPF